MQKKLFCRIFSNFLSVLHKIFYIFLDAKKSVRARDLYLWQRINKLKPHNLVNENGEIQLKEFMEYLTILSKGKRKRKIKPEVKNALNQYFWQSFSKVFDIFGKSN